MSEDYTLPDESAAPEREGTALAAEDPEWTGLLRYLHTVRGFDFHGYKSNTLVRRVRKRMATLGLEGFAAYQDHLEVHPDEFGTLFNTILINVTAFFRDPAAWEIIRDQVVPSILAGKAPADLIRVWSAGCASGEEAYSIAMLLAEGLGREAYRDRVKIYATDVDDEALSVARHATYTAAQVEGVPTDLLGRYFEQIDGAHVFRHDLRRQVIFGRHDLISDAPISRIDLLLCRNTLMYFNAETQARVLARLHFALNDGGYLFLGRAETLMAHGLPFQPVDLKRRISRKAGRGPSRVPRHLVSVREDGPAPQLGSPHLAALEASPIAHIVVDSAGSLVLANECARGLFQLRETDLGRSYLELQLSHRLAELRSLLERSETERRQLVLKDVEWLVRPGDIRWLDIHVAPLAEPGGATIGTAIAFTDVTAYRRLQQELEESHHKLETAYEELQASNEELQSTNEELETTNEELQSTVEELETTNEELQSTSEEMETMNEELQSTNEELHTINDELRQQGDELGAVNAFLHSVLGSLRAGVAVVDRDLHVLAWNPRAEDLWGLRADEAVGQHLLALDIGLPLDRLRTPLRSCLAGEHPVEEVTLQAVTRRGRTIRCLVRLSPLFTSGDEIRGAILLMEAGEPPG